MSGSGTVPTFPSTSLECGVDYLPTMWLRRAFAAWRPCWAPGATVAQEVADAGTAQAKFRADLARTLLDQVRSSPRAFATNCAELLDSKQWQHDGGGKHPHRARRNDAVGLTRY